MRVEIETPHGPLQRSGSVQRDALASLSMASDPTANACDEPTWPSGWRPWLSLFGGFLLMFNSWGWVNTYGTYSSFYNQHLLPGKDLLLLNLIGATQSAMVLALSGVVGRLLDAGYRLRLLVTGTILLSLGTFLLSVVNGGGHRGEGNYGLIWLTQGFISGLGMGCFFVSSSQIVATWFKKRKGFAIGVVASGASVAGLILPILTKFLITEVGFNNAVRYVATVITATSILAVFIARPNPMQRYRKPPKWSDIRVFVDKDALKNASYCWFTAAICFLFLGFYAVFFTLEEWAAHEGLGYRGETPSGFDIGLTHEVKKDAIRTFYLLSIMNGASTIGRLGSSYLCDHFGALNVHAIVTAVASLLILAVWTTARTVPAAIAFVVAFGIFSGSVIGLPPASVAFILGTHDAEAQAKLGQWTGMMYTASAIFALTGPVIAGHLISRYDRNFLTVQLWSGACLLLSACCMGIAIFYRKRTSARQWMSEKKKSLSSSVNSPDNTPEKSQAASVSGEAGMV
ncbi:hypothetical protein LTR36_006869 [Oleoguttula mirabilis]|uniref:MFS general substrate transporter n=1 Tax=Oleoguttula mirabilis TaxID=1507867 RepID=A0AAV9JBX4_9PEZI|nr:hypothetical protein LTR36_006869 [Oleoguttula mirabilis]